MWFMEVLSQVSVSCLSSHFMFFWHGKRLLELQLDVEDIWCIVDPSKFDPIWPNLLSCIISPFSKWLWPLLVTWAAGYLAGYGRHCFGTVKILCFLPSDGERFQIGDRYWVPTLRAQGTPRKRKRKNFRSHRGQGHEENTNLLSSAYRDRDWSAIAGPV